MDDYKVDFHIHTTASDGEATPTQIVKQAKELEYDIIAITDHDNTDGIAEAKIAAEAVGIRLVPGIEIAVITEEGTGLHMLGYDIDTENEDLRSFLRSIVERRKERNTRLFGVLSSLGYDISADDVKAGKNEFISKPSIAQALLDKGYIKDIRHAYSKEILASPRCKAIRNTKPLAEEAIRIISGAGGIPVLAHPIQTRGIGRPGSDAFYSNMDKIIRKLKIQGLKGLECFHPDQDFDQSMRFVEMAEKYHLHITRGSDFHGKNLAEADKTANER